MIQNTTAVSTTLTGPGTVNGILTVTSTTGMFGGARGTIDGIACEAVSVTDPTHVVVRYLPGNVTYNGLDLSAVLTGKTLSFPAQTLSGPTSVSLRFVEWWNGGEGRGLVTSEVLADPVTPILISAGKTGFVVQNLGANPVEIGVTSAGAAITFGQGLRVRPGETQWFDAPGVSVYVIGTIAVQIAGSGTRIGRY